MHWICRCVDEINFDMCWLKFSINSSSSHLSSNDGRNKCLACNEHNSSSFGFILIKRQTKINRICFFILNVSWITLKWCIVLLQVCQSKLVVIRSHHEVQILPQLHVVYVVAVFHYHSVANFWKKTEMLTFLLSIWLHCDNKNCSTYTIIIHSPILNGIVSHQNEHFGKISWRHFASASHLLLQSLVSNNF